MLSIKGLPDCVQSYHITKRVQILPSFQLIFYFQNSHIGHTTIFLLRILTNETKLRIKKT